MSDRPGRFGLKIILFLLMMLAMLGLAIYGFYFVKTERGERVDPVTWVPVGSLDIREPVSALTKLRLKKALRDDGMCKAALATAVSFEALPEKRSSEQCHILNRVAFSSIAQARTRRIETRCDMALRVAMWMEHGVQPAAEKYFGMPVKGLRTQGSYNCRKIFGTQRMSKHAQAKAIDVAGFTLVSGRKVELKDHWNGTAQEAAFLRDVRDSACTWFATTLSPDYNAAHADHFHLQSEGWGTCR